MTLKVAVIGAGRIAEQGYLPGFQKAGAEVVAVCAQSNPGLKSLAERFGIGRCYYDWRALLADGGFDAVSICTPPVLHAEMAVESLSCGYATLVEKPMALNIADCDRMIATARTTGKLLMVAHNQRFMPRYQLAKRLLTDVQPGNPQMAYAVSGHRGPEHWNPENRWYFQPKIAGTGALGTLASQKIDLLGWLTGQQVRSVQAFTTTFQKPTSLDDTAALVVHFHRGMMASIQVSWTLPLTIEDGVTLYCENGVLRIPVNIYDPLYTQTWRDKMGELEATYPFDYDESFGVFAMVAAFVEAVEQGLPAPVTGEEGRAMMRTVFAAYQSATQHSVVQLFDDSY